MAAASARSARYGSAMASSRRSGTTRPRPASTSVTRVRPEPPSTVVPATSSTDALCDRIARVSTTSNVRTSASDRIADPAPVVASIRSRCVPTASLGSVTSTGWNAVPRAVATAIGRVSEETRNVTWSPAARAVP